MAPTTTPVPMPTTMPSSTPIPRQPTPTPEPAPTATPTPQPKPTATLPAATPAPTATPAPPSPITKLDNGAWLERNQPTQAARLRQLPWVADGVADAEREAAEDLITIAQRYPDVFDVLMEMPWIQDGITESEATAVAYLNLIRGKDSEVLTAIIAMPWVQDGITESEARVIRSVDGIGHMDLASMATLIAMPWVQDDVTEFEAIVIRSVDLIGGRDSATMTAIIAMPWVQDGITRDEGTIIRSLYSLARRIDESFRIINMPFLDDVTVAEAQAVFTLDRIGRSLPDVFRTIISHPKVKDGITDREAMVLSVFETPARREPEIIPLLLDGLDESSGVYIEERTIELPLTGETLLTIVRTQDRTTASMDYLEHAVRFAEKFMSEPLPTNYVALYFGPNTRQTYTAHNWYSHMAMGSDRDGPERKANVFAHEVGHYYFRSPGPRWIHEGAAEIITFVSEYERAGYPLETHLNPPCENIKTLPASDPDEHKLCAYFLGGSFFIDLYRTLGEDDFLRGFRALYHMRLVDTPDDDCFECTELSVHHVLEAFTSNFPEDVAAKAKEVLVKWYGPLPQSP